MEAATIIKDIPLEEGDYSIESCLKKKFTLFLILINTSKKKVLYIILS